MRRALLSVSDKRDIVKFAKGLEKLGFEIVSTGGTFKKLQEAGVDVIEIDRVTKFPECFEGRVKTLKSIYTWWYSILKGIIGNHQKRGTKELIFSDRLGCVIYTPFKRTLRGTDGFRRDFWKIRVGAATKGCALGIFRVFYGPIVCLRTLTLGSLLCEPLRSDRNTCRDQ